MARGRIYNNFYTPELWEQVNKENKRILDDFLAAKLKNGIKIRRKGLVLDVLYRIYDTKGEFLAISRYNGNELVLEKSFWS